MTEPTKIMGFDVSCHFTDVEVVVNPHGAASGRLLSLGADGSYDASRAGADQMLPATSVGRQRALQAVLQSD